MTFLYEFSVVFFGDVIYQHYCKRLLVLYRRKAGFSTATEVFHFLKSKLKYGYPSAIKFILQYFVSFIHAKTPYTV
jgi:hypothetical protein